MLEHEAAAVRHIIQHRAKVTFDREQEEYTITISGLDEDLYMAWNQFANDVACHVLERLVVKKTVNAPSWNPTAPLAPDRGYGHPLCPYEPEDPDEDYWGHYIIDPSFGDK